jgi:hypothetical protein
MNCITEIFSAGLRAEKGIETREGLKMKRKGFQGSVSRDSGIRAAWLKKIFRKKKNPEPPIAGPGFFKNA